MVMSQDEYVYNTVYESAIKSGVREGPSRISAEKCLHDYSKGEYTNISELVSEYIKFARRFES